MVLSAEKEAFDKQINVGKTNPGIMVEKEGMHRNYQTESSHANITCTNYKIVSSARGLFALFTSIVYSDPTITRQEVDTKVS